MRYGLRWNAALLVLALMIPAAAGALPAQKTSWVGEGWSPWSRLVAYVSSWFGSDQDGGREQPQIETSCGIDPNGSPKCDS